MTGIGILQPNQNILRSAVTVSVFILVQKLLSAIHLLVSISIEVTIRKYELQNNKEDPSVA